VTQTWSWPPLAINNTGTVAGIVDETQSSPYKGFVDSSGTILFFQVPGATETWANGISAIGEIVGYCARVNGTSKLQNFSLRADKFKFLPIPNIPDTLVNGINPSGSAIVGYYPQKPHVADQYYGFLYQNNVVTTIQFPGAFSTWATGINDNGEVVGYFQDASLNYHGFTWTPSADAEKK